MTTTTNALYQRNFPAAFAALRKLLADGNDTAQVFVIMRALNGPAVKSIFTRLMATPSGPQLIYRRTELAQRLVDPDYVASFGPGTVGAAYRCFLEKTGYSADGLADVSNLENDRHYEHPYAWVKRRARDVHDIWHILTGYAADEHLGEAALVAFSYAQTRGLGWALIAAAAALKSLRVTRNTAFARAVWEGYRRGRKAAWLLAEDYEALLQEPLASARVRLRIGEAAAYRSAQARLGDLVNVASTRTDTSAV